MLRFKPGHKLSEHFYVRQDGTRAYYFSQGNPRAPTTGCIESTNTLEQCPRTAKLGLGLGPFVVLLADQMYSPHYQRNICVELGLHQLERWIVL